MDELEQKEIEDQQQSIFEAMPPKERARTVYESTRCWVPDTLLQRGCCMILLITIPFCIVMMVMYLQFHWGNGKNRKCSDLCDALRNTTDDEDSGRKSIDDGGLPPEHQLKHFYVLEGATGTLKVEDHEHENTETERTRFVVDGKVGISSFLTQVDRTLTTDQMGLAIYPKYHEILGKIEGEGRSKREQICDYVITNPPIAALVENLHRDDNSEKTYKCMALILNDGMALSSGQCFRDFAEGFSMEIRLNSTFWSKNGIVSDIEGADFLLRDDGFFSFKNTSLVLVRFNTNPNETMCFDSPPIIPGSEQYFDRGRIYYWGGNLALPLKQRRKFAPLQSRTVAIEQTPNLDYFKTKETGCPMGELGGPLFSPNGTILLGVHLFSECHDNNAIHYYTNILKYSSFFSVT